MKGVCDRTRGPQLVMGAIQAHFPPEFANRIDEIIIFVSDSFYDLGIGKGNPGVTRGLPRP